MAQNVVKDSKKSSIRKPKSESKMLNWLGDAFNLEKAIGKEFPVRYIDRAAFLLLLGLVLIGFRLNAERQVRKIRKLTNETHQLQAAYTIRKAHYMKRGKQSELAPQVKDLGLVESKESPYRVVVKSKEE